MKSPSDVAVATSNSHSDASPGRKIEIKPLTGFRGWAATVVMIYHFGQPPGSPDLAGHFQVPKGYLAVDAFFMLSAFVLCYTYANLASAPISLRAWADFMIKRLARLYPAYYAALTFALLKLLALSGPDSLLNLTATDWIGNLLMATGWGMKFQALVGTSWSASAELGCYLCFPFALRLFSKGHPLLIGAALIGAVIGLIFYAQRVAGVNGPLDLPAAYAGAYPLLRAGCGFTVGMCLFKISRKGGPYPPIISDGIVAGCLLLVPTSVYADSEFGALAALAGLIFGLSLEGRLAALLFGNFVALGLGRISYSLYLLHPLLVGSMLRLGMRLGHGTLSPTAYFLTATAYAAISLAGATIIYTMVERRGRQVILRLAR